jgi:hypothetical protein
VALSEKIVPDEAEDEEFGYSKASTTTKYGAIFTATRRAEANFPDFCVGRRSETPGIRRSSLLELGKIGFQRRARES